MPNFYPKPTFCWTAWAPMARGIPRNDKQAPRWGACRSVGVSRGDYILATVKIMDGTAGMFAGFVAITPRPGTLA